MELIDEFFYVDIKDSSFPVSRATKNLIVDELKKGTAVLEFVDLYGDENVLMASAFERMRYSTPESRNRVRDHNRMIDAELREYKKRTGWSPSDEHE